jgi:hypothetical protein
VTPWFMGFCGARSAWDAGAAGRQPHRARRAVFNSRRVVVIHADRGLEGTEAPRDPWLLPVEKGKCRTAVHPTLPGHPPRSRVDATTECGCRPGRQAGPGSAAHRLIGRRAVPQQRERAIVAALPAGTQFAHDEDYEVKPCNRRLLKRYQSSARVFPTSIPIRSSTPGACSRGFGRRSARSMATR